MKSSRKHLAQLFGLVATTIRFFLSRYRYIETRWKIQRENLQTSLASWNPDKPL